MAAKQSVLLALFGTLLLLDVHASSDTLTNALIWSSRQFSPERAQAVRSMNDGEHFTLLQDNRIVQYRYTDFDTPVAIVLDSGQLGEHTIDDYSFNADETKLLIATKKKKRYRRSFTAKYYLFDIASGTYAPLFDKQPEEQLATFSPDGTKVAFVYENNLYYRDLQKDTVIAVTSDGRANAVINGATTWVYEEEFAITKGFYWSPGSTHIAFLTFDESEVSDFTLHYYRDALHPTAHTYKYPKAGENNARSHLVVYRLEDQQSTIIDKGTHAYIPRVRWTTKDHQLVYLLLNRHQNELAYVLYDRLRQKDTIFYREQSETYVEVDDDFLLSKDGKSLLITTEKSGFNHIHRVGWDGAEQQLTAGNWDVVELKGLHEERGWVYYTSAERGAIYKDLYVIGLDGTSKRRLSQEKGTHDAAFSKGMKYCIHHYSNAHTPHRITVDDERGEEVTVLVDNQALKKKLVPYGLSPKQFITVQGAAGHALNAFVIRPPDFDSTRRYPVYFDIYNGPGYNTVSDQWKGRRFLYQQLLAQKGYIVMAVDTRGTMYRGAAFKKATYLQLGKLETEDMIAVAKAVQKWPYVDPDRIGIMGWSYGGYMASLCMTKGASVFKMGIAVAPVTNWKWYDTIYTERFMRTPQENKEGYAANSPINHAQKMKGKYLLVHGDADDNVHVQHTMEMADALVEHAIDFDLFIYPNRDHGIYGGKTRLHLFNRLLSFTLNNL